MRAERETPKVSPKVVLAATVVLFIASVVFAIYSWSKRGVCADMTVSAAVALVSLICAVILSSRMAAVSSAEKHLDDPIFLVKTSEPSKKEPQIRPKGKIPDH